MTDQDPYAYGATWVHNDTGAPVHLLTVFEDTDGLTGYQQKGMAYVTFSTNGGAMPWTWEAGVFLTMFSRPDGSAPAPELSIPRQRTEEA